MLFESNLDIKRVMKRLDQKAIQLKTLHPNHKLLIEIGDFYKNIIVPWVENYSMENIEPDTNKNEEIINSILDIMNKINRELERLDGIYTLRN